MPAASPVVPEPESPLEPPLRVLVVSVHEEVRSSARRALAGSRLVFEVEDARDAAGARRSLEAGGTHAVLLDAELPGEGAMDLLRHLRAADLDVPVIVMTRPEDDAAGLELMKCGASDYLPRLSVSPERAGWTLRNALRIHRAEGESRRAAKALARHSDQIRLLARAATDLGATLSIEDIIRKAAESAREILGARFAVVRTVPLGRARSSHLACSSLPADEERARALADALEVDGGARPGGILAPLAGASGERLGAIHVVERVDGTFTDADEAILVQLAQMASVSIASALLLAVEQAATRSRDDLIAIVSHDLRNPLSTIAMGASLLLAEKNERNAKVVPRIQRAAKRMETLLSDLLDMTRIEAKILAVEPTPHRVEPLVEEAIDPIAPLATSKGVTLTAEIPPDLPRVVADRHRVLQVLGNVIGNAVKFTDAGGQVTVTAAREGEHVQVCVADTGKGIAPDHLARLFERYWQAGDTANQGTGLGLFIAKGIVEAHGGRIWAESGGGRGTKMTFTLPVAREG